MSLERKEEQRLFLLNHISVNLRREAARKSIVDDIDESDGETLLHWMIEMAKWIELFNLPDFLKQTFHVSLTSTVIFNEKGKKEGQ